MKHNCKICGIEFKVPPNREKRGNVAFCSNKCKHLFNSGPTSPRWKEGKIGFSCKLCGKEVYKKKNKTNAFCSLSCSIKFYNPILRPINTYTKKCRVCDCLIEGSRSRVARASYCSAGCMSVGYKAQQSGPLNGNFKLGNYVGEKERSAIRASRMKSARAIKDHTKKEWDDLKKLYGCQCANCKQIKPLEKDHIVPISKGGHNGIDNIQPLCKRCNVKKHTKEIRYSHQLKTN